MNEEQKIELLKIDSGILHFVTKQFANSLSNNCKWIAIKDDPWIIERFAETATEDMIDYALSKRGMILQFITNPNKKQILTALKVSGLALQFVNDPTKEMVDIAVKQNKYVAWLFDDEIKKVRNNY